MRALLIFVPAVLMAQSPPARPATAKPKPVAAQALATDEEKAVYALGLSVYRSLGRFDLSPDEIKTVQRAISDAAAGKPAIDAQEWAPKVQELARTRALRAVEREKAASEAYLEKAAMQPGVVRTESSIARCIPAPAHRRRPRTR
jgi:FKBP-type peptidyl-prolyl cis-trans isomerase FkpA